MKPKYSILIQDLSADQVRRVVNEMDSGDFFTGASMGNKEPLKVHAITEQPTAPENFTPPFATPAAAPVASVPQNPETKLPVDTDSTGLKWDERIHSGSKGINKDGSWKKRKGVQQVTVDQVEAELRASVPTAPAVPSAPPVPQAPAPAAPVTPAVPVPGVPPVRNFQGLMNEIGNLFATSRITPDYPQSIVKRVNDGYRVNIVNLTDVGQHENWVEYAWQCIDVDVKAGVIKAA